MVEDVSSRRPVERLSVQRRDGNASPTKCDVETERVRQLPRARATDAGLTSIAVTRAPRCASQAERTPAPQPTSSTVVPPSGSSASRSARVLGSGPAAYWRGTSRAEGRARPRSAPPWLPAPPARGSSQPCAERPPGAQMERRQRPLDPSAAPPPSLVAGGARAKRGRGPRCRPCSRGRPTGAARRTRSGPAATQCV